MDSLVKAANSKRFIVEDSITKVTSDGEPHEMMTIVAVVSGLLAAVAILAVLVALVACKSTQSICRTPNKGRACQTCPTNVSIDLTPRSSMTESKRTSVSTIYARIASIPEESAVGNFEGNLNSAFVGSELNLAGSLRKPKKKPQWRSELEPCKDVPESNVQETKIAIERF